MPLSHASPNVPCTMASPQYAGFLQLGPHVVDCVGVYDVRFVPSSHSSGGVVVVLSPQYGPSLQLSVHEP